MLFINYKGDTPQQRFYTIGIQGNNKANKIVFAIAKKQADLDLSSFNAYLKVENKEGDYKDKIELNPVFKYDEIHLTWEMTRKSTAYRNLALQVVFENNDEDIVWQTLMCEIELNSTIKVDEEISDKYPTILQQLQKEVNGIKADKEVLKNIKYEYDEEHNLSLLVFPKGVLPTMFEDTNEGNFYFDYDNEIVVDYDNNQIGNLHIWDSVVSVWLNYQMNYEPNPDNFIVEYMSFDGNYARINTYYLYHAQSNDQKVLDQIIFNGRRATFPKYVAPLDYYNDTLGYDIFFDYADGVLRNNDGDQIDDTQIEFDEEGRVVATFEEGTHGNSADELTYIFFNTAIYINSFDMLYPHHDKKILDYTDFTYDIVNDRTRITYPLKIMPVKHYLDDSGTYIYFDYEDDNVYDDWGNRVGVAEKIDGHYTADLFGHYYKSYEDNILYFNVDFKDYDYTPYINTYKLLNGFSNRLVWDSDYDEWICSDILNFRSGCAPKVDGNTMTFLANGSSYQRGSIKYQSRNDYEAKGGVLILNKGVVFHTLYSYVLIANFSQIGEAPLFIPNYCFTGTGDRNDFINAINGSGGEALYISENKTFAENVVRFYRDTRNFIACSNFELRGVFKHTLDWSNGQIVIYTNKPKPITGNDLNDTFDRLTPDTFIKACYVVNGGHDDEWVEITKFDLGSGLVVCRGFDTELGTFVNDTFTFSDFIGDVVEKI